MPSNNKNKGFTVPGNMGQRLATASNLGATVLPSAQALQLVHRAFDSDLRLPKALAFLEGIPLSGARVTSGAFILSERTHAIIERDRHFGALSALIAPMVTAPKGAQLMEVSVGWVEFDTLLHYSTGNELKKSRAPGVNTWSYIAERAGIARSDAKRAFFTALYSVAFSNDIAMAWEKISYTFPELRGLRENLMGHNALYLHRRANDTRLDLFEEAVLALPYPLVFAGATGNEIYLEIPNERVGEAIALANTVDSRISVRVGETLADFVGPLRTE
jgi:hypothetical protein